MFGQKPVQTNEGDREEPMEEKSSSALGLNNAEEVKESTPEVVCKQELQVNNNLIIGALNSKSPSNVVKITREHCPRFSLRYDCSSVRRSTQPVRSCADVWMALCCMATAT